MTGFTTQAVIAADGWSMHGNVGFGWWMVMTLAMILFWGGVIALIVWLLREGAAARRSTTPHGNETAIDILDRRFAAGDLSVEEYHERRQLLDDREHPTARRPEPAPGRGAPPNPATQA